MLTEYLGKNGFRVKAAHRGDTGLRAALQRAWALILLDVMLPGMDGFEVLKRVRAESPVSVLLLTARGEDVDRIVGLEIGADDYLPKPFNPRELLARMRAVLRRAHPAPGPASEAPEPAGLIQVDDLVVDAPAHKATLGGRELQLTSFEFRVLVVLARRAGEPVTREELASAVLPKGGSYDPSVDRSLDVHVSHLRQKMGDGGREPRRIRTVRGIGYVLVRRGVVRS